MPAGSARWVFAGAARWPMSAPASCRSPAPSPITAAGWCSSWTRHRSAPCSITSAARTPTFRPAISIRSGRRTRAARSTSIPKPITASIATCARASMPMLHSWRASARSRSWRSTCAASNPLRYISSPDFRQDAERIGILLVNTGTPDSLECDDIRRYLARFLSDPRVIELPRWLWTPILHGYLLRTRPRASQVKYRRVWTADGAPLLSISRELRTRLASNLAQRALAPFSVELGMLYSTPSVAEGLAKLQQSGAQRILVLPLFPQYSGAATGAVYDQVAHELARWRWLPELRFVADYHDHPGFAAALRDSILAYWQQHGRTGHLLL